MDVQIPDLVPGAPGDVVHVVPISLGGDPTEMIELTPEMFEAGTLRYVGSIQPDGSYVRVETATERWTREYEAKLQAARDRAAGSAGIGNPNVSSNGLGNPDGNDK